MSTCFVFYGWIIAFAGLVVTGSWALFHSYGVFFKPVANEFGWGRGVTSSVASLQLIVTAVAQVVMGRLSDKYGVRRVLALGALIMGAGLFLCGQAHNIWQFYLFYGVASAGLGVALAIPTAVVQRWFIKNRGMALGIVSVGVAIGELVYPPVANYLIYSHGWRMAYMLAGSAVGIVLLLCAWVMFPTPEMKGFRPYGATDSDDKLVLPSGKDSSRSKKTIVEWTTIEALKTPQFYSICILSIFSVFGIMMVLVHIVPFAIDIGISPTIAAGILSIIGGGSFVGRLAMGRIADRIGWVRSFFGCAVISAIMLLSLATVMSLWRSVWSVYLFAVIFGSAYGGRSVLIPGLVGVLLGTRSLAELIGLTHGTGLIGGAIGIAIAGFIYDNTGSYGVAFGIGAVLFTICAVIVRRIKPPQKD